MEPPELGMYMCMCMCMDVRMASTIARGHACHAIAAHLAPLTSHDSRAVSNFGGADSSTATRNARVLGDDANAHASVAPTIPPPTITISRHACMCMFMAVM